MDCGFGVRNGDTFRYLLMKNIWNLIYQVFPHISVSKLSAVGHVSV